MSEKFQAMKEEVIFYLKNNKTQAVKAAILAILFVIAAFLFFVGNDDEAGVVITDDGDHTITAEEAAANEPEPDIYIDVGGAVNMPGVVSLPAGSRVFEAISAVGGVTKEGDTSSLNLAAILSDGDKIYIPTIGAGEQFPQSEGSFFSGISAGMNSGKINLNRASSEQLQLLQGVGPAMAERIIEYRNNVGIFKTTKELMNVSGIGEKTFKKLEDRIEV